MLAVKQRLKSVKRSYASVNKAELALYLLRISHRAVPLSTTILRQKSLKNTEEWFASPSTIGFVRIDFVEMRVVLLVYSLFCSRVVLLALCLVLPFPHKNIITIVYSVALTWNFFAVCVYMDISLE